MSKHKLPPSQRGPRARTESSRVRQVRRSLAELELHGPILAIPPPYVALSEDQKRVILFLYREPGHDNPVFDPGDAADVARIEAKHGLEPGWIHRRLEAIARGRKEVRP